MGESKRGGGGGRRPTTSDIAQHLAEGLATEKREPSEIRVHRVTEALFAVEITVHGESEPEAYFLSLDASPEFKSVT